MLANITGHWQSTLVGLIGGVLTAVGSYITSGNQLTWEGVASAAFTAVLGALLTTGKSGQ